jgi:hypothetical protein
MVPFGVVEATGVMKRGTNAEGTFGNVLIASLTGRVCHFFISFWEIQNLDGPKSEKMESPFYELLSFSLSRPSSFWISRKLIHKSDEKLKQTPP